MRNLDTSLIARILYTVFSDYYHEKTENNDYRETRKIRDDFGKDLFGFDYSEAEWNADFNFFVVYLRIMYAIRSYYAEQTVVAADGKLRKMVCLPEFFIYGWIFSIQSQNEDLQTYKLECYRVLYEHFHGTIGGRKDLLKQKAQAVV